MKLEDILQGSYTSEKSKVYKKALRKFKKNRLLKYKKKKKIEESITRDEAMDIADNAFVEIHGEVPEGPGYYKAIDLVLKRVKGEESQKEIKKIIDNIIMNDIDERDLQWSWEDEPKDIKQSQERSKEIKDFAKKLKPGKKLKL